MTNSTAAASDLEEAIALLREAAPSPESVRELAERTKDQRRNPHTFHSLFHHRLDNAICRLCGFYAPMNAPMLTFDGKHPAHRHVDWHNAMYRAGVSE